MGLSRIVLASSNPGKLAEFGRLLSPLGAMIVSQSALGIDAAEEPHVTFIENALVKARHASVRSGLPALADDSGICVNALGGAPGVYSARFAERASRGQGDEANNRHLVESLHGHADRSAYYYCVLVLLRHADDPQPIIADAVWRGEVLESARGSGGFGYDPYFLLPELGRSAAELDMTQKNLLSHRGQAAAELLRRLQALGP